MPTNSGRDFPNSVVIVLSFFVFLFFFCLLVFLSLYVCSCFAILLTLISTDFLAPLSPMVIPGSQYTNFISRRKRESANKDCCCLCCCYDTDLAFNCKRKCRKYFYVLLFSAVFSVCLLQNCKALILTLDNKDLVV